MRTEYQKWLDAPNMDADLLEELKAMSNSDIEEAFYKDLTFGTGGMRGIIGAGTNRLNRFTIAKAVYSFGRFLLENDKKAKKKGVAIAHDNRHKSPDFAVVCVEVLAAMGIRSYLYDALRPTPVLSYAVRETGAAGGIMITASHNPPNYNGIKMYDEQGCQLVPSLADKVIKHFENVTDIFAVEQLPYAICEKKKLVKPLNVTLDDKYLAQVASIQLEPDIKKTVKIVFTPLHGTSRDIGVRALSENGYDVYPVKSQMTIDPDFKTVDSPNPENETAFEQALKLGRQVDADLLIATDPDADRLGLMVKHQGEFVFLSGNQTGAIFIEYLLSTLKARNRLPQSGIIYNTVVSSELAKTIATAYGVKTGQTLTGFKFIGEQMHTLKDTDTTFLMGYEESYGYVFADFVRDKDAIQSMVMAAEIANVFKAENMTLIDYLETIYDTYGHYRDHLINKVHEGKAGQDLINAIMEHFRNNEPKRVLGNKLLAQEDYLRQVRIKDGKEVPLDFPKSNVLKFIFENDMWFVLRPSGTEPKLKIYLNVLGKTKTQAADMLEKLEAFIEAELETLEKEKGVNI